MTWHGFALFLHIGVAIVAFMIAGVLHAALPAMARAREVSVMRSWAAVVHRLEPLLPIMALLLLALGAWLIHLSHGFAGWSDGWILTSVIALVVIEGLSGALLAPRSKALIAAVDAAPAGEVPDALRAQAADPVIWHLANVATVTFLGVVFVMASKPSTAWSVSIVVVGALLGLALSQLQLRALPVTGAAAVPGQRPAGDTGSRVVS